MRGRVLRAVGDPGGPPLSPPGCKNSCGCRPGPQCCHLPPAVLSPRHETLSTCQVSSFCGILTLLVRAALALPVIFNWTVVAACPHVGSFLGGVRPLLRAASEGWPSANAPPRAQAPAAPPLGAAAPTAPVTASTCLHAAPGLRDDDSAVLRQERGQQPHRLEPRGASAR